MAEILREKIIVGVIARGQKLKQAEIARLLGVSITPVREALRLLEAQGYVAVRAHRGAIVAPFVVEGAEELYELRQVLETRLIPSIVDQNLWAQSRIPMDMRRHGWLRSLFQASQR
jgi:DNA-binding GntR family transcriptional regulator